MLIGEEAFRKNQTSWENTYGSQTCTFLEFLWCYLESADLENVFFRDDGFRVSEDLPGLGKCETVSRNVQKSQFPNRCKIKGSGPQLHYPMCKVTAMSSKQIHQSDDASILPEWFKPCDKDVICGWARQNHHHRKCLHKKHSSASVLSFLLTLIHDILHFHSWKQTLPGTH